MHRRFNPPGVPEPASNYAQVVETSVPCRWLYISGQVGVTPEGQIVEGFEGQCRQTFENLVNCLKAADMDVEDLVKITIFILDPRHLPVQRAIRDTFFGDTRVASTLLVIDALAAPDFQIEIEGTAAKPL